VQIEIEPQKKLENKGSVSRGVRKLKIYSNLRDLKISVIIIYRRLKMAKFWLVRSSDLILFFKFTVCTSHHIYKLMLLLCSRFEAVKSVADPGIGGPGGRPPPPIGLLAWPNAQTPQNVSQKHNDI
jgi:hypothetical protein